MHHIHLAVIRLGIATIILAASLLPTGCATIDSNTQIAETPARRAPAIEFTPEQLENPSLFLVAIVEAIENWPGLFDLVAHRSTEIAKAMANAGDKAGAKEVFSKILTSTENPRTFRKSNALLKLAEAMAITGDTTGAKEILAKTLSAAEELNNWNDEEAAALRNIAEALVIAGDMTGAKEILFRSLAIAKNMRGDKAVTLRDIGVTMAKAGDMADILAITEEMKGMGKVVVLREIADAVAVAGNTFRAKDILSKAITAAEELKDEDKAYTLSKIAEAMVKAGDKAGAKVALSKAFAAAEKLESWAKANALRGIAVAMAEAGDTAGAIATAEKIEEKNNAYTLREVAKAMVNAGDKTGAKETLSKALAVAEKLESWAKADALREIAKVMLKAGDTAGGKVVLSQALAAGVELGGDRSRAEALLDIAEAMAKAGMGNAANEVFFKATAAASKLNGLDRGQILYVATLRMTEAGNIDHALYMVNKAELGWGWNIGVAEAMTKAGYKHEAKVAFSKAVAVAENTEAEGHSRSYSLFRIAEAMLKAGDKAGAIDTTMKMEVTVAARRIGLEGVSTRDRLSLFFEIARAIATEEVRDAKGEAIKDVNGNVKRKMKQSFAPEDKPLVARIVALLK